MTRERIRIGLIGTGAMGDMHARAYRMLKAVFPDAPEPVLELLGEADDDLAERRGRALGFRRWTGDWRSLVADPGVDLVDITTPVHLHREMALAAIAAGKHVYCEKPLALTGADARALAEAAEAAGVVTAVGFDQLRIPLTQAARDMIERGEIGVVTHFRGIYDTEEYLDPDLPFTWRFAEATAGSGVVHDLAAHTINLAHVLVGEITEVVGMLDIKIPERADPTGQRRSVETDDQAGFLVRFANGATGVIEVSRIATGRKYGARYEVTGSAGAIAFDMERMNELRVYRHSDPEDARGFRTVLVGPAHGDYGRLYSGAALAFGYNDQKMAEIHDIVRAIASNSRHEPDFRAGWRVNAVIDAVLRSCRDGRWTAVET